MGLRRRTIILLLSFLEFFGSKLSVSAQGCSVGEGGPISTLINDIHEGIIFDLQTTGITGIEQHTYGLNINDPPYVDVEFENSRFVMRTNERFSLYEENEVERSIVIIVRFRCSSNNHLDVTTTIHLHDTNNHAPRFIPTDHYHYVLDAPVPPGYQVTGCLSELIARDVDLTTERIIFDIEQNQFFGITYSSELSNDRSKEFIAIVTTKTFIRNLPEEMTLTITATDVHGTEGEGSHTTSGKITIKGNTNFVLPNEPVFSKTIYNGIYTAAGQVELEEFISLQNGYDDLVRFSVEETYKINFRLVKLPNQVNQIMIEVLVPLEEDILLQGSIAIEIIAEREFTSGASATVILQLPQVDPVQFESAHYDGKIENNNLRLSPLLLSQGYEDSVVTASFVQSEYSAFFSAVVQDNIVTVSMTELDQTAIDQNSFINLQIVATARSSTATAVITLEIIKDDNITPVFEKPFYTGTYDPNTPTGLAVQPIVFTQGYDGVESVVLRGDHEVFFRATQEGPVVTVHVSTIPAELFDLGRIVLSLEATKPRTVGAKATLIVTLPTVVPVQFESAHYDGKIENNNLRLSPLLLSQGYEHSVVTASFVQSEYSAFFSAVVQDNIVTVSMTELDQTAIDQNSFINLQIVATARSSTATAVITLEIIKDDNITPVFEKPFYTGTYDPDRKLIIEQILFSQGYDGVDSVAFDGEHKRFFTATRNGAHVTIEVSTIPPELFNLGHIILPLQATKPRTVGATTAVIITLPAGSEPEDNVSFQNLVHRGTVQDNVVQHEDIRILGFDGTTVDLHGEYSDLFAARVTNGLVSVALKPEQNLPAAVTRVALELHARSARAVLLLNVLGSGIEPSVEFSPESYAMLVSTTQTGIVGRVSATSNNNEAITYSIDTDNGHLLSRLSINNEGELHLSAPVDSGVYTFQVVAATAQARATATVHLTSQTATVCDDRGIVVPPLIVIDRDEEEEHRNLVVLDPTQHAGCRYTMTNRWPTQQSWLYVDETGLHTTAIDREHESIAFMSVSQVQVELLLQCDNDPVLTGRSKRSYDWLDPYEYGSNKWILTDSIPYNSRRTLVNLIVNDINDNAPIFVGKENEPIAVGYPSSELEERILPRSLAELQATDADIGINAALRYSSSESVLAVAPTTGFVHVRSGANLQHNQVLTVTATDQNGEGLSGTIQLVVKLLDVSHIAVVTVRDIFLDDEKTVLTQLSDAVGYEVKALRSVVVSDDINEDVTRHKRQTNARTSLQLYVYGLVEQEPVVVTQLTSDLNNQAVIQNIITIPLETHLENGNTAIQTAVGLLISTIILSVLLFAALCVIGVWFFLRWKKSRHYNEFTDNSSLASGNASLGEQDKPEEVRPRLNIEELKKSEKRLQERLAVPMEDVAIQLMPRKQEPAVEAILDMPVPQHSVPIVIQSFDKLKDAEDDSDNDEFGEVSKARRKSVVTFNENVEKIIHVQNEVDESETDGIVTVDNDGAGSTSTDDIAIYRL